MRKFLTFASFALNALVLAAVVWVLAGPGLRMLLRSFIEPAQARRISSFETFPVAPGDIVFLGDSITEGGAWDEMFAGAPVRNRGIGGDTSAGVLARTGAIARAKPAKVFLLIGTNDLFVGAAAGEIAANVREILARIADESASTQLYVQSVLPRAASYRDEVEALNAQLEAVAREQGATWIDLYPAFLDPATGAIQTALSNDELHLLGPGYALWRQAIAEHVE
jgi:lysophospholipase L1-like esterase